MGDLLGHRQTRLSFYEGDVLSRTYTVERHLGSGGFGEVYLVRHRFLGQQAMKLLRLPIGADLDLAFGEARTLVDLTHPAIVRTYHADILSESRPVPYMTMEYASAGTLAAYLSQHIRLPESEVALVARQVCEALEFTHVRPRPLVHGDLKPSNILLFGQGIKMVKLSDFGLAKSLDPVTRLVSSGGTAAFAAPEIAWGIADERSDVYSLGVTLYRCLTGIHPFPIHSASEFSMSRNVRHLISVGRKDVVAPSRLLMKPSRLDDIIMACLEYDLFARPKSGTAVLQALDSLKVG